MIYLSMKKFRVYYWRETGDDCIDCEKIVEEKDIEMALLQFKRKNPFVKIREIREI